MKKEKKKCKFNYRHIIAIAITLGFMALAIFKFNTGYIRIWESLQDLFWSICYYFAELFDVEHNIEVTVNNYSVVPWTPFLGLPATWEEFVQKWETYWDIIFTKENFVQYMIFLSNLLLLISRIIVIAVMPLVLILYLLFDKYLNTHNNDYNRDSKPLTFMKWCADMIVKPVVLWIKGFLTFVSERKIYRILWFVIWGYNFNFFVVLIEFFAYYFYFAIAFDFLSLYKQLYKLLCDASVMIAFIPTFVWCCFWYWVFDKIRKSIAYKVLYHHEAMNCGFINERPIVTMTCGTMGKKKTTMITDMTLLQEKMFRDKALELMLENDLKFPNFPWINLENFMRFAMDKHIVYSLATIRKTVKHLRFCFEESQTADAGTKKAIRRHLKRRYNLKYENYIFGYDYEKYGLTYDDKLKTVNIWSVIESYAQLYFVYVLKSTLIVSNYSIRTDSVIKDLGNLPLRDNDFYHRNSKFIYELSRYSNIIDFDALRLGRKVDADNPKKDSFEFGCVDFTEGGKERKNNLQLQETKKKDEGANQKNDGFNDWLKMIRHSGTIDYFPFCKVFTDEQRPESWGADGRDLCEIIHIRDGGKTKLAMPFFALEELIYALVYDKFVNLYKQYRHVRADNTVPMYTFKKLMSLFQRYYKNVYNQFGYSQMRLQVESGTQDGELDEKTYYLDNKRIYSDRFSTDCFSEFFTTKSLRSRMGFDDLEEYQSSKATFDELKKQNSYFIADLTHKQENDK